VKTLRAWTLRLGGAALIAVGLTGPAPGDVGGCGSGVAVASPVDHCEQKNDWTCIRENFAGRSTDEERAACQATIPAMCAGATWPEGCMPTPAASAACIDLLRDGRYVDIPTPELLSSFNTCNLCP